MIYIGLNFIRWLIVVQFLISAQSISLLGNLLQLIPLVQSVHVFESLTKGSRHLLIQVLVMSLVLANSIRNELVCACLLYVVIEPGQVKFIHAEADQVQKRLDVVYWTRVRVQLVLAHRSEHRVAFEVLYFLVGWLI